MLVLIFLSGQLYYQSIDSFFGNSANSERAAIYIYIYLRSQYPQHVQSIASATKSDISTPLCIQESAQRFWNVFDTPPSTSLETGQPRGSKLATSQNAAPAHRPSHSACKVCSYKRARTDTRIITHTVRFRV